VNASSLKLLLGGDLMLGRGIDQQMPQHCDPALHEAVVRDARHYAQLAARRHGALATPFGPATPWGASLAWMEQFQPELRIVNLETAITTSDRAWPGKGVHFRLHPANITTLQAARLDGCSLANNHSLDWGYNGLADTLRSLRQAGIQSAGAGLSPHQAQRPARWQLGDGCQLLLFAWAFTSSGVPPAWTVQPGHPGVALVSGINNGSVKWLCRCIKRQRRPGDRVVVSLHWGANWVPVVPEQHRWLARQLIELAGVDVVFGHSSHHPLPLEIHQGRLILYGCGDLINDYEGLPPHGPWRSDLVCLYGLELERRSGALTALAIQPYRLRGFQLQEASGADRQLLEQQLGLEASPAGWRCRSEGNGWRLEPACSSAAALASQPITGLTNHP
jgi:poly-gamma-glutamate capsule biosynthesis protein CapA/YwtB (metallophosphatase superfamily)